MGKRILYFDVVKCFAIFLVIWGHCLIFCNIHFSSQNLAHSFISSFHMPLFMLISGFFSHSSFSKPVGIFLKQKSKQLLLPVFSWEVIVCLYIYIFYFDLSEIRAELIGGLWFLRNLFVCYIIVYFCKKTHYADLLLCLLTCIVFFLIPHGSFLQINRLLPFFWLGYFIHKYYSEYCKYRLIISITSSILFFFLLICQISFNIPEYIPINIVTLLHNMNIILYEYLINICGSLMTISFVYYLCKFIKNESYLLNVSKIGVYTLGIYATQSLLVNRILQHIIQIEVKNPFLYEFIITPIVAFIMTILCCILVRLLSKNHYLNFILFGEQY